MIKDRYETRYEINYDPNCNLWCVGHYWGKTLMVVSGYATKEQAEAVVKRLEKKPNI